MSYRHMDAWFELEDLPGSAKAVLGVFCWRACPDCGLAWNGIHDVQAKACVKPTTVKAALEVLKARGLLQVHAYPAGGRGRTTEYLVVPGLVQHEKAAPCVDCQLRKRAGPRGVNLTTGSQMTRNGKSGTQPTAASEVENPGIGGVLTTPGRPHGGNQPESDRIRGNQPESDPFPKSSGETSRISAPLGAQTSRQSQNQPEHPPINQPDSGPQSVIETESVTRVRARDHVEAAMPPISDPITHPPATPSPNAQDLAVRGQAQDRALREALGTAYDRNDPRPSQSPSLDISPRPEENPKKRDEGRTAKSGPDHLGGRGYLTGE